MLQKPILLLLLIVLVVEIIPTYAQEILEVSIRVNGTKRYKNRSNALGVLLSEVPTWHLTAWDEHKIAGNVIVLDEQVALCTMKYSPTRFQVLRSVMPTPKSITLDNPLIMDYLGGYLLFFFDQPVLPSIGVYRTRHPYNDENSRKLFNFPLLETQFPNVEMQYNNCVAQFWTNYRIPPKADNKIYGAPLNKLLELQFPRVPDAQRYGYSYTNIGDITCRDKRDCFGYSHKGEFCNRILDNNIPVLCGQEKKLTFIIGRSAYRWDELEQEVEKEDGKKVKLCFETDKVELIPVAPYLSQWLKEGPKANSTTVNSKE